MPLLQEITAITKANDVPMNVWVGGNGFTAGTAIFSVGYESLAARAAATSRLMAAKGWWEVNRKMREHVLSSDPDIIMNYVRGGSLGAAIPVGTVVQTNQFQLVQGADFMGALKWGQRVCRIAHQSDWRRSQHCSHDLWRGGWNGHDHGFPEFRSYRCFAGKGRSKC